jgi:cell division protein FtsQ
VRREGREGHEPRPARAARPPGPRTGATAGPATGSLPEVYRRRRRLGLGLAGLLLLVGLGLTARVLLYDVGLADVEQVRVGFATADGAPVEPTAGVLTGDRVADAAAVVPGGPLAAVDTRAVAERVAALPAVASARVDRDWPHTVSVQVVQRVPVASLRTTTGPALVDATGAVFPGPAVPGLPELSVAAAGPGDPSTAAALATLAALPDPVRAQVLAVAAVVDPAGGRVTLALTEDREVRWGAAERAPDKARTLVALLTQPGRIYDVTSPDLPTITP